MSALQVTNSQKTDYPHYQATQEELQEIRDRAGKLLVEAMRDLVASKEQIIRDFETTQNASLLGKGMWYPTEYCNLLTQVGKQGAARIEWLRNRGDLAHGYLNHKMFNPIRNQIGNIDLGRRSWQFLQKEDVLPTEALRATKEGLAVLDCGAAVTLARYIALEKFLGSDKFNCLFKNALNIGYEDDSLQPMRHLVDFTSSAKDIFNPKSGGKIGDRPLKIGQVVSMNGVHGYLKKHPSGMGGNYNVICSDAASQKQRFIGHGVPSEGASELDIYQVLVEEYNKDYKESVRVSPEHLEAHLMSVRQAEPYAKKTVPTENPNLVVSGYDRGSPQDFIPEVLFDLVNLPKTEVSLSFIENHPFNPANQSSSSKPAQSKKRLEEKK